MKDFSYHEPKTIKEAVDLMLTYDDTASIIAGGTDLLIEIKQGKKNPDHVISLRSIPSLQDIIERKDALHIGAMVTHRMIEKSDLIRKKYTLLVDAVDNLGSVQVRNVATIGGNLCNGAPSADTAAPIVALEAILLVEGPEGEREIAAVDFFEGPGKTALKNGEILKKIIIPKLKESNASCYIKHSRRKAMDLPLLGVAVIVDLDTKNMVCKAGRIALSLAAPTPLRTKVAEAFVSGKPLNREVWQQAGALALSETNPRSSFRATAEYRRRMIQVLIPRAAEKCLERLDDSWRSETNAN